ncbi:MAG: HD domain-containing protein [Oscillospiraceae bacterium]|nr:HD domain-containing protein [Oscillospiraceae bacterium]
MPMFDFVPIKLDELPIDFEFNCDIYSKKFNELYGEESIEFALLCSNRKITEELIAKLKQAVFPDSKIYVKRESIVSFFFDKGYPLGYNYEDAEAIKRGESPWRKKKEQPNIPQFFKHITKGFNAVDNSDTVCYKSDSKLKKTMERYDEARSSTMRMMERAKSTGIIDTEHSEQIVSDVQKQINDSDSSLIIQTINRVRSVDEYLYTHSLNVAYLNGLMGKWLRFTPERQSDLALAGLLHDIGKLKIDQIILNKPERLTAEEFEVVKKHPDLSLKMLVKSNVDHKEVLEGVIQHHEKLNGTGYPLGIGAKSIGVFARITSISDIYDAMVTKRCYKDPLSPFSILDQFMLGAFSELDLSYVDTFIDCMAEDLKGKEVVMNDDRIAKIRFVNTRKPLNSIVEIDGQSFTMNDELHCVRMNDV